MTPTVEGPNHSLFVQVLAQIEREPQRWDQVDYETDTECGTAHCFAGWACALNGLSGSDIYSKPAEKFLGLPVGGWCRREHALFDPMNTLDDLYRISADILGIDEQVLREKVAAEVADGSVQP